MHPIQFQHHLIPIKMVRRTREVGEMRRRSMETLTRSMVARSTLESSKTILMQALSRRTRMSRSSVRVTDTKTRR